MVAEIATDRASRASRLALHNRITQLIWREIMVGYYADRARRKLPLFDDLDPRAARGVPRRGRYNRVLRNKQLTILAAIESNDNARYLKADAESSLSGVR